MLHVPSAKRSSSSSDIAIIWLVLYRSFLFNLTLEKQTLSFTLEKRSLIKIHTIIDLYSHWVQIKQKYDHEYRINSSSFHLGGLDLGGQWPWSLAQGFNSIKNLPKCVKVYWNWLIVFFNSVIIIKKIISSERKSVLNLRVWVCKQNDRLRILFWLLLNLSTQ